MDPHRQVVPDKRWQSVERRVPVSLSVVTLSNASPAKRGRPDRNHVAWPSALLS